VKAAEPDPRWARRLGVANRERLFQALGTTHRDGLGMGLSISRSIILSHEGHLWATPNASYAAPFQFVVPAGKGQQP